MHDWNHNTKLPALRAVEALPHRRPDGQVYFQLRDPSQLSPEQIAVPAAGYFVLTCLDGTRSCTDIQRAFHEQVGMNLPADQILNLVKALDQVLLLDNNRARDAAQARRDAYAQATARDNRDRYPDAEVLRAEIHKILAAGVAATVSNLRGLVAPHLDYARGAPCYADAYGTLAAGPLADRYIILGTNHAGAATTVVATRKDFLTPLGQVETDRATLEQLETRLAVPLCEQEIDHALEHSIELQVHILQVLHDGRPFQIVPLLCPDACGPTGTAPADGVGPDLAAVGEALAHVIEQSASRTIIVAGADLSHIGQRFGDPHPSTPAFLASVAETDRTLLSLLESRSDDAFIAALQSGGNPTRVCSSGCLYTLARALPEASFRLLRYHQATSYEAETHVTCASAILS